MNRPSRSAPVREGGESLRRRRGVRTSGRKTGGWVTAGKGLPSLPDRAFFRELARPSSANGQPVIPAPEKVRELFVNVSRHAGC